MRPLLPLLVVLVVTWARPAVADVDVSPADIDRLIAALGDPDFDVREAAAARLAAIGPRSIDALLAAAETSADLEVALRAGWLAGEHPLEAAADPAVVRAELRRYARTDAAARGPILQRLLRLDDDAGIEALARIVRLDRSTAGSRRAAALLVREFARDDPAWPLLRPRIAAGIGAGIRPAVRFVRAVVEGTGAPPPAVIARAADEAAAALDLLERAPPAVDETGSAAAADASALVVMRRCLVELEMLAGRRDRALEHIRRLFTTAWEESRGDDDADATAVNLVWAVEHGLPEAVDLLEARWPGLEIDDAVAAYAAAVALAARGDRDRAARLADAAHAADAAAGFVARFRNGLMLAKWGATEWAIREYRAVCDDPQAAAAEFALAGISFAELLHDLGRDVEAAEVLRRVADGRDDGPGEAERALRQLDRDPALIRARAAYFAACAAAARGDLPARDRLLDDALQRPAREVDALIARYQAAAGDAAKRAAARDLVARTLERIDDEILALPEDPNGYNEYAWLVANTEGDVQKAIRYSRRSLELGGENSSYLDTLAHCRFAAGDQAAAIRIQSLARRLEPHSRTIRRNLDRFRAAATGPVAP